MASRDRPGGSCFLITAKDPRKVAAGKAGMRARWGTEPRVVRLDTLTESQRRLVLALVNAARQEAARDPETA